MDEQQNELIPQEPAPEPEQTPKPANMRTHYLIRILVGGYLAYLGWQLMQTYIKGTASSMALAVIAGVAFMLANALVRQAKAEGKDLTPPKYYLGPDFEDTLDEIRNNPI